MNINGLVSHEKYVARTTSLESGLPLLLSPLDIFMPPPINITQEN